MQSLREPIYGQAVDMAASEGITLQDLIRLAVSKYVRQEKRQERKLCSVTQAKEAR